MRLPCLWNGWKKPAKIKSRKKEILALPFTITYQIDDHDCIAAVSPEWNSFALQNDATHLTAKTVLHQSLWSYIQDAETKGLYQFMTNIIRQKQKTVRFPFRCDSPQNRRFMEMEILLLNTQNIEFRSTILRIERREVPLLFKHDRPANEDFLKICSWCKRACVQKINWVEIEEAIKELSLFAEPTLPRFSHSICPDCYKQIMASL